ncbi:hypothetical protein BDQ17DRAFT_1544581 [Cyathus striatus]|nr:hypothetical protein BDQ17DRAFT_1544581 [Cyathus striatus]
MDNIQFVNYTADELQPEEPQPEEPQQDEPKQDDTVTRSFPRRSSRVKASAEMPRIPFIPHNLIEKIVWMVAEEYLQPTSQTRRRDSLAALMKLSKSSSAVRKYVFQCILHNTVIVDVTAKNRRRTLRLAEILSARPELVSYIKKLTIKRVDTTRVTGAEILIAFILRMMTSNLKVFTLDFKSMQYGAKSSCSWGNIDSSVLADIERGLSAVWELDELHLRNITGVPAALLLYLPDSLKLLNLVNVEYSDQYFRPSAEDADDALTLEDIEVVDERPSLQELRICHGEAWTLNYIAKPSAVYETEAVFPLSLHGLRRLFFEPGSGEQLKSLLSVLKASSESLEFLSIYISGLVPAREHIHFMPLTPAKSITHLHIHVAMQDGANALFLLHTLPVNRNLIKIDVDLTILNCHTGQIAEYQLPKLHGDFFRNVMAKDRFGEKCTLTVYAFVWEDKVRRQAPLLSLVPGQKLSE